MLPLGSGSSGSGRTSRLPFFNRAEKTPQWEVCGLKASSCAEGGLSICSIMRTFQIRRNPILLHPRSERGTSFASIDSAFGCHRQRPYIADIKRSEFDVDG